MSMEQIRNLFLVPFFGVCWVMLRSGLFLTGRHLHIDERISSSDFLLPYLLGNSSIGKSNTLTLQPDLSAELPEGGILFRLGDLHKRRTNVDSSRSLRIRKLNPHAQLRYDIMWNDFRGAFDQDGASKDNVHMLIPWREPHEPLFVVVYGSQNDFQVEYLEGPHSADEYNSTAMEVYNYPRRDLYYRKRTGSGGRVTLCTQITPERLKYLHYIVQNWGGPVSAVVYVGYRGNQDEEVGKLNKFWDEILRDDERANLDLHVVYDDKKPWYSTTSDPRSNLGNNPYPVNLLRQISIDCANTDWILMIEGDMLPIPNGHSRIEDSWKSMMRAHQEEGGAAFVVPLYRKRKPIQKRLSMNPPGTSESF